MLTVPNFCVNLHLLTTKMMEDYTEDIRTACNVMKRGGIILYPTDTVWGIGCDATNSAAVKRIFELKRRADSKSMITLVADMAALERIVENVPDAAEQIIEASDKPVTVVYDHGQNVAPELLASDGSLGVRVTSEKFSQMLCRSMRRPIVSTSANISGQPTPHTFAEISKEIIDGVDYVCTSRRNVNKPSKASLVIKISDNGVFKILRG